MNKVHSHNGHGHCAHCTHFCAPCNDVYCCKCSETWGKYNLGPYYVPYQPIYPTTPWYKYTITSGGTSDNSKNFVLNMKDMGKNIGGTTTLATGYSTSGTHDHEHQN